jgi:hypothetical protein
MVNFWLIPFEGIPNLQPYMLLDDEKLETLSIELHDLQTGIRKLLASRKGPRQ